MKEAIQLTKNHCDLIKYLEMKSLSNEKRQTKSALKNSEAEHITSKNTHN